MHRGRYIQACLPFALALTVTVLPFSWSNGVQHLPLQPLLISVKQMPRGWMVVKPPPVSSDTSLGCLNALKKAPQPNAVTAKVAFSYGALPQMLEGIASNFSTAPNLAPIVSSIKGCNHFSGTDSGLPISGRILPLTFPKLGDQSVSYAIALRLDGLKVQDDFVIVRRGVFLVEVELIDYSPSKSFLLRYVKLALARLEGVRS